MKTRAVKTRALALAAAVSVLPVLGVVTASPAAASNCGYPSSPYPYVLRVSPNQTTTIAKGSSITISTRLVKGNLLCGGRHVYLYVHGRGEFVNGVPSYHLSRTATTDANGLARWTYTNQQTDFRFYTRLEGTTTHSPTVLIQVR